MPALQKQPIPINFAQGLDLKTDPNQVSTGRFLGLKNTNFNTGGLLQKRNGFGALPSLDTSYASLTSYKGNLIGLGTNLSYYNADSQSWAVGGAYFNVKNTVVPLVRNNFTTQALDSVVAPNGLVCSTFQYPNGQPWYTISDKTTGEVIVEQTAIPNAASGQLRVFVLGNYFIITAVSNISGSQHIQYYSIPLTTPSVISAAADITTTLVNSQPGYDGFVVNNTLYLAWYGANAGGGVRARTLTSTLVLTPEVIISSNPAQRMTVTADLTTTLPVIWITSWDSGTGNIYTSAYDHNLVVLLAPTSIVTEASIQAITSAARDNSNVIIWDVIGAYTYTPNARTDHLSTIIVNLDGSHNVAGAFVRGVGLAGKAVQSSIDDKIYVLATYGGPLEPTYFLIDTTGETISKLAASNGGGYVVDQIISNVSHFDNTIYYGYQFRDLLLPVNKSVTSNTSASVYTQSGLNLVRFDLDQNQAVTSEIGNDLQISGGFVWMYDGGTPVEHGFHLYPEDITAVYSTTGGSIVAKPDGVTNTDAYAFQVTYEWTDLQGNIHRSAPSVPIFVTTSGTGTTGSVVLNIPTLRITAKTVPNPVRIVIYRWSVANPVFYISTTDFITNPILNNTAIDSVSITITVSDSQIVGNPIIYTNGGVVENIAAPATTVIVPYKSRLFALDSEDRNLLWFSKQVIESTPVEFSDLFTIYVAPTIGTSGSTGDIQTLYPMDDKLIIGKQDALYYIFGNGPDNVGANNDFSDPTFITATVGCANQQSFVMIPDGLMFQSDKGIWLLARDMSTHYIGADVESLTNGATVKTALSIPGTNQVRFTLDSDVTLMYDYFYKVWTSFYGIPGISSVLYQGLHTYLNSAGAIFQETPGLYLDGSNPVLISFTTSWIQLAGLQGYQRAYYFYMLAKFISPHKLNIQIAYDYDPNPTQSTTIMPSNYSGTWGSEALWGDGASWGGESSVEQHRVFLMQQKCQSFQITAQEIFDGSYGTAPGAGLTISGLNLVIGTKKGYPVLRASKSFG